MSIPAHLFMSLVARDFQPGIGFGSAFFRPRFDASWPVADGQLSDEAEQGGRIGSEIDAMRGPLGPQLYGVFLQRLFEGTRLGDRDFRLGLMEKSTADLVATKDPFILLAAAMEPLEEAHRESAKNRGGAEARLMPRYMEALLAKAGGLVA